MNALLEKYLNASLTAGEAAALAQAFAENPALADEFAAATRIECDLRIDCKEQAHTALYTRRMERAAEETEAPAAHRRTWGKPLAAAAGVALLAGGGLAFLEFRQPGAAQQKPAPNGKVSRVPALIADASTAAGEAPRGDAAAMKRKLRRFVAGSAPMRGLPVSQALNSLESQWKSFDHRDPKEKDAVAFTIAGTVLKTWKNPDDEPRVSLEIPGISLLTSVEVVAAQAGLRAAVTPAGVTLEPEKRADDGKSRTWTLPLPAETFTAFLTRAGSGAERSSQELLRNSLRRGYSVTPLLSDAGLSWMKRPELAWEIEANLAEDGQTIDLNLAPEVIEFEGFINYGEPIQTTGINALGQSEPVILTDSKITQPVFATRVLLDHPGTLTRLLAAHSAITEGITWDQTNGTVTARGSLRELRTASAVLAAVREVASTAISFDLRVIEWEEGTAPTHTGTDASLVLEIARRSRNTIVREQATVPVGRGIILPTIDTSSGQPIIVRGGTLVMLSPDALSGHSIQFSANITRGQEIKIGPQESINSINSETRHSDASVTEGEWLRVDFPARGDVKAATVLIHARVETLAP